MSTFEAESASPEVRHDTCSKYTYSLFDAPENNEKETNTLSRANLGTFQDSLRAPVHRWFTYPAGFSYRAVEEAFRFYRICPGMTVYDPFAGTGTTNLVAKQRGVHSFGIEAHPFVYFVARTKLYWEFDTSLLLRSIDELITCIERTVETQELSALPVESLFPELVCKCYSREKLALLYVCREAVCALPPTPFRDFARLGLTNMLRSIADVATGWPYIAPQKAKNAAKATVSINIATVFRDQLYSMLGDLQAITRDQVPGGCATLIAGDSRQLQTAISSQTIDLAFTSPPYLNNYDYADRTRLETYFWGEAKTWGDITRTVRKHLILSATTQINRSDYDEAYLLSENLCRTAPHIAAELKPKIADMAQRRLTKGGKKSYDVMVAGYFNDMLCVLQETFRILKPGGDYLLILGDSAPYGVHIPTEIYLGELGKATGFSGYEIEELRTRGGKWKDNPQRHDVALKECLLTLHKA